VFQASDQYDDLAEIRQSVFSEIQQNRPLESERPSAMMLLFSTSDDASWAYELNQPGYYAAHTRPLGATFIGRPGVRSRTTKSKSIHSLLLLRRVIQVYNAS
jgi:hypothetical protein